MVRHMKEVLLSSSLSSYLLPALPAKAFPVLAPFYPHIVLNWDVILIPPLKDMI